MEEFLAETIVDFLCLIFTWLQNIDLSPVATAIETLTPYLQFSLFLLPAQTIGQIFNIIIIFWTMRLTIKTIKLFWDLIPIL